MPVATRASSKKPFAEKKRVKFTRFTRRKGNTLYRSEMCDDTNKKTREWTEPFDAATFKFAPVGDFSILEFDLFANAK